VVNYLEKIFANLMLNLPILTVFLQKCPNFQIQRKIKKTGRWASKPQRYFSQFLVWDAGIRGCFQSAGQ
jgi:hypothetical protein